MGCPPLLPRSYVQTSVVGGWQQHWQCRRRRRWAWVWAGSFGGRPLQLRLFLILQVLGLGHIVEVGGGRVVLGGGNRQVNADTAARLQLDRSLLMLLRALA